MSGHSKWENIKRKKGKTDAIRARITTKISKEITIAARMGGGDPVGNMRLKLALTKAKQNNVPKENIQRAIAKGVGAASGAGFDEVTYEGYGPGGAAVIVECNTDNRNRAAAYPPCLHPSRRFRRHPGMRILDVQEKRLHHCEQGCS